MATSRTIAANNELIEDSEILVIYDGLLDGTLVDPVVQAMLPDVVTGAAGAAVDFLAAIEIRCTGAIGLYLTEFNTGKAVAYCPPFSTIVIRSFDVGGDTSIPEWKLSDNRKEIKADAAQAAIADLAVTDGTTAAQNTNLSTGDVWNNATAATEFDTVYDAVIADYETNTDASFAEVETNLDLFLARFAGGLLHATS